MSYPPTIMAFGAPGGGVVAIRIADFPESDRPRERLARVGVEALSDRELLALVVCNGGKGANAVDLGAALISNWGSAAALGRARLEDLQRIQGVGEAKAASLIAAFELGRRAISKIESSQAIVEPADLVSLVRPMLIGKPREEVVVVVMNAGNSPLRVIPLSAGSIDHCLLPVRDALSAVLRNDGVAFALCHNHPSGEVTPSPEDLRATLEIEAGSLTLGLRLLDHVIIGGKEWFSVREAGLLNGD